MSTSSQEFHCPDCGALLAVGADHCWKCRREFQQTSAAAGSPIQPASSVARAGGSPSFSSDNPPFARVIHDEPYSSVGSAVLVVFKVLVAVVVAVVAACTAFFATCLSGVSLSSIVAPGRSPHGSAGIEEGLTEALVVGGVAGIIVLAFFIWLFWFRPRNNRYS
jgi:hypothetical protein